MCGSTKLSHVDLPEMMSWNQNVQSMLKVADLQTPGISIAENPFDKGFLEE